MKIHINKIVPARAELLFCAFLTLVLGLLSATPQLLSILGLTTAARTLQESASDTIGVGLSKLDSYSLTTTVVTFLVWAVIGLLTLSILQAVGHALHEVDENSRVSSNAYIHPSNFNRKGFWRAVILTGLGSFCIALGSFIYIIVFCLYLLPLSALYVSAYISTFALNDLLYCLLGLALLFVSISGLAVCARLLRFRHELFSARG